MDRDGTPPSVSIVIPTLTRPGPLTRAMTSIRNQEIPADVTVELIVVDNSPAADARAVATAVDLGAKVTLHYISVPRPGVATARNAGVAAARGRWIAFLDDDEEAGPGWLTALLRVMRGGSADAVFGPVEARAEGGQEIGPLGRFFSRSFEHQDGADITADAAYLGTNNSMFTREACLSVSGPFDPRLDGVGGEDSLFLRRLVDAGRRLAWARNAGITEWVPPRRLSWRYVNRRKFLSGQIRTFVNEMLDPPQWSAVLLWMGVGVVQCCVGGPCAAVMKPLSEARARRFEAMAWGGLGKVFWMRRFRPSLYGAGLVS